MRVPNSANSEGVAGIASTAELLFGKPPYGFIRQTMTDDVCVSP